MKSKTLWLTMLCLALLTVMTVVGGARLRVRAKQTPINSSAESAQGDSKKAAPFADKIDPKTLAIMRHQAELRPAVDALYEAAMKSPDSGFTTLAFEGDGLALYWKGELPTEMIAALNVAREIGPVEVIPAAYSMAEMEAEAAKISKAKKELGANDIQAVVMRYDGSGLDIERMPPAAVEKKALMRARAGQPPLWSAEQVLAKADLRMPIRVTTADEPIELMSDRYDDVPPWNGGGYWEARRIGPDGQFRTRSRCTTGFGIRWKNRPWVLTSAHCATTPDIAFQGTARKLMGPVAHENYPLDLILIDAPGFFQIFDNPGLPSINVVGSGPRVFHELLCASGVATGTVCGLQASSFTTITVSCSDPDSDGDCGYEITNVVEALRLDGRRAVRPGDSGAPVFSFTAGGALAKGIVTGGSGSTGARLYYQDWPTVSDFYKGAVPVTP